MAMSAAYWYYPPGQQVYPLGLKFYFHHEIRQAMYWCLYPPILVEEDLNWTGVWSVHGVTQPEVPEGKMAVDGTPALINGLWMQQWDIVDAPPPPDPAPEPDEPETPPVDPEPLPTP